MLLLNLGVKKACSFEAHSHNSQIFQAALTKIQELSSAFDSQADLALATAKKSILGAVYVASTEDPEEKLVASLPYMKPVQEKELPNLLAFLNQPVTEFSASQPLYYEKILEAFLTGNLLKDLFTDTQMSTEEKYKSLFNLTTLIIQAVKFAESRRINMELDQDYTEQDGKEAAARNWQ